MSGPTRTPSLWKKRPSAFRLVVILLWIILLFTLARSQGILTDKEALKYIGCAEQVIHGDFRGLFGNYAKYGAYVIFILPSVALHQPLIAVLLQATLSLAAAFALARISMTIIGDKRTANAAFAIFLLMPLIQSWVLALYTESFFTSLTVLFMEQLLRYRSRLLPMLLLGLVVVFARPVGMLFVGASCIWWMEHRGILRRYQSQFGVAMLLLLAISIPGIARDQLAPIVEGHVICGFPELPHAMDDFHGTSILAAQEHLLRTEPLGYVVGLALRRIASLFTPTRPYFSIAHNVVNGFCYLIYPFAMITLWKLRRVNGIRLIGMILLVNTLLIGLTHDEWSARFLVPLLPLVILLATCGMHLMLLRAKCSSAGIGT